MLKTRRYIHRRLLGVWLKLQGVSEEEPINPRHGIYITVHVIILEFLIEERLSILLAFRFQTEINISISCDRR